MKKINIYTLLSVSAFLLVVFISSCKKDYVNGGTKVQSLAGEWWVKLDGGTGEFGNNYYNLVTYNTASNADSLWFDDGGFAAPFPKSFWQIKGRIGCNVANQTFSGSNIANQDYSSQFTITDGKILTNAAHAPGSGDKTDSIYCKISFSDETGSPVHTISGYKRTGFAKDDH